MKPLHALIALCFMCEITAGERNQFFAMDTIARGKPAEVVPLLKELGYAGLGGTAGDGAMADALKNAGLKLFNGYITLSFDSNQPALDEKLRKQIDAMKGHDSALWLAVSKIVMENKPAAKSSSDADALALTRLREIADYAEPLGVKIALYPHTGFWLERVEDAIRVADKLNRPSVGVTFNLCHWLKVEGAERDPSPVLKAAHSRLMFVTINGADTGDTKKLGWDKLIQPLGSGSYDVGAFMRLVRASGFTGPVGFQGYGIKGDPRGILSKTIDAWMKMNAAQ